MSFHFQWTRATPDPVDEATLEEKINAVIREELGEPAAYLEAASIHYPEPKSPPE